MAKLTLKLKKKEEVADDTMAFYWQVPDDFTFKAGQFGDFTLLDPRKRMKKATQGHFHLYIPQPKTNW
ncbi:hypothetical protein P5G51_006715 [Virgibacillus sp. 179-BFC.A HS]|uniref:Uncharacterized protein n=1 Tax=Tigheibacillus jepli TaxID=3035914 RepID=A0ABU5CH04_9BACI|nr:hypothetical protein [Virgibacillus sp. 179-BFC.A HS]MDY0405132.1 hypothetical protein [Virgibacillus sp. 179-BFC.A HS]